MREQRTPTSTVDGKEKGAMRTPRPFCLLVDSGSREEPPTRYFGTFQAAREAARQYDTKWHPFIWITELTDKGVVVHVRDGKEHDTFGTLCAKP